jgi:hypothetical protein
MFDFIQGKAKCSRNFVHLDHLVGLDVLLQRLCPYLNKNVGLQVYTEKLVELQFALDNTQLTLELLEFTVQVVFQDVRCFRLHLKQL